MNALNPDNLKGKITEDRGCWSWTSNTLATWCKEGTHWKRPWCWERLRAEGEGDDRGWDGWMASPTQWTWVWVDSRSWWWTGKPGVLWFMGLQRVGHDWATELNWTEVREMKEGRITEKNRDSEMSVTEKTGNGWKHISQRVTENML